MVAQAGNCCSFTNTSYYVGQRQLVLLVQKVKNGVLGTICLREAWDAGL